jgi:hypothetical protein
MLVETSPVALAEPGDLRFGERRPLRRVEHRAERAMGLVHRCVSGERGGRRTNRLFLLARGLFAIQRKRRTGAENRGCDNKCAEGAIQLNLTQHVVGWNAVL